jgi:hypothetical protein
VLFLIAFTLVVTVVLQQPWYTYNLMLLYPPLLGLVAGLTSAPQGQEAPPPRGLGWISVAVWVAPWAIYSGLVAIYLGGRTAEHRPGVAGLRRAGAADRHLARRADGPDVPVHLPGLGGFETR